MAHLNRFSIKSCGYARAQIALLGRLLAKFFHRPAPWRCAVLVSVVLVDSERSDSRTKWAGGAVQIKTCNLEQHSNNR